MNRKFKIKTVDPLDTIGLLISQYYFNFYEFTVELPLLWLRIFCNKGKDYKNILSDLIEEIDITKGMIHEQSLWVVYLFYKLKSEIIKKSENLMNKKANENLNEKDINRIIKILNDENGTKNLYFILN